jgi:hypothetical protein
MWIEILRREVEAKGPKAVAVEIGYSRATVDLVLRGTYEGNLDNIEERVMSIYGTNGKVHCEQLGEITPSLCAEKWTLAKKIGMKAGNPDTLRLYKACLRCSKRSSKGERPFAPIKEEK